MSATGNPQPPETEEERRVRLAREAQLIAEARAEVARGELIDLEDVSAWVESWGADHELPMPRPRPT
jgi:predicted transcriptional regulator